MNAEKALRNAIDASLTAAYERGQQETVAKLDEQLAAAVRQTADNSKKLLEWDFAEDEARCRQLASMYLDEVRQLFVGWPEKRIKSADAVLAEIYERGRREALEEAANALWPKDVPAIDMPGATVRAKVTATVLFESAAAIRALMPTSPTVADAVTAATKNLRKRPPLRRGGYLISDEQLDNALMPEEKSDDKAD